MPAEPDRRLDGQDGFTVVRRGYKRAQVDQVLAELRAHVDTLVDDQERLSKQNQQLADRLTAAIRRAEDLAVQVKHLSASAGSADGLSERIRVILELAADEANAMKAEARDRLQQTKASQAELDHRIAQMNAERTHVLAAAQSDADRVRQQAISTANAHRADAEAEAERVRNEARTTAANVVADAQRAAAADVDRLRKYVLEELPRGVNAVIGDALGQLPSVSERVPTASDSAGAVVLPKPRPAQPGSLRAVPDQSLPSGS